MRNLAKIILFFLVPVMLLQAGAIAEANPSPTVTSITPESGVNTGTVNITAIMGSSFASGATVRLVRAGLSDIIASSVSIWGSGRRITCTFDLTGQPAGVRDVVINLGRQSGTLRSSFTINNPVHPPFIWDITGSLSEILRCIAVGDENNDGEVEIYAGTQTGEFYRFKWNGSSCSIMTKLHICDNSLGSIAIGDGNNDGANEIYLVAADSVYQLRSVGFNWYEMDMGSAGDWMTDIAVGDGDGDGSMEVYVSNQDYHLYQYKWNGTSWTIHDMGLYPYDGEGAMMAIAIGDGDDGGSNEVYAANVDGHIYEYEWRGPGYGWINTDIGYGGGVMHDVFVSDGDNDGEMEVYGANSDHKIYQFKRTMSGWIKTEVGSGDTLMHRIFIGDGDNDGYAEVYGANWDEHLYQFKWSGSTWVKRDMGSGGAQVLDVAVGDGNNDGLIEVYACISYSYYALSQFRATPAPTVSSIYPESGVNTELCNVTLFGSNFVSSSDVRGLQVKLVKNGYPDIDGWLVNGVVSPNKITCTFPLWGQPAGIRDVVVTTTDGITILSGTLESCFSVLCLEETDIGGGGEELLYVAIGGGDNDGSLEVYGANHD